MTSSKPFVLIATPIVRKHLNQFVKLVHPDLLISASAAHPNARSINQTSLASLNSILTTSFPNRPLHNSNDNKFDATSWKNTLPDNPIHLEFYCKPFHQEAQPTFTQIFHRLDVWPTPNPLKPSAPPPEFIPGVLSRSLSPTRLSEIRTSALATSFLTLCQTSGIHIPNSDIATVHQPVTSIIDLLKPFSLPKRRRNPRSQQKSLFSSKELDASIRTFSSSIPTQTIHSHKSMQDPLLNTLITELRHLQTLTKAPWIDFHASLPLSHRIRAVKALQKELGDGWDKPVWVGYGFVKKRGVMGVPWDFGEGEVEKFIKGQDEKKDEKGRR